MQPESPVSTVSAETYDALYTLIKKSILAHPDSTTTLGAGFLDVPQDKVIIHGLKFWPNEQHKVELSITTDDARSGFEWLAEVTFDDQSRELYGHFLLKPNHEIVEAYGRKLFGVDEKAAKNLLTELKSIL